jgi:DNA invertase Pin-like site-specific DNA recombinase
VLERPQLVQIIFLAVVRFRKSMDRDHSGKRSFAASSGRGTPMKAIAYYRVSTASQGRSGLGLDAQRHAVQQLAVQRGLSLLAEFTEVETGRRDDRPVLKKALARAKLTEATLVIAKLDRLSRNAAFLLTLRDSGARFLAADVPDANDLTIGVLAVIAQAEREMISRRSATAQRAFLRSTTCDRDGKRPFRL